jgi:hypothetical protein
MRRRADEVADLVVPHRSRSASPSGVGTGTAAIAIVLRATASEVCGGATSRSKMIGLRLTVVRSARRAAPALYFDPGSQHHDL